MGLIYDMEVRKDVKGGSPKSPPRGVSVQDYQDHPPETSYGSHGVSAVWRTVAVAATTCVVTMAGAVFTIGLDNVKHSEVDAIMASRAPYMHDKQRIEDHFKTLETQQENESRRMDKLESVARDDFDKRIRQLEQSPKP